MGKIKDRGENIQREKSDVHLSSKRMKKKVTDMTSTAEEGRQA